MKVYAKNKHLGEILIGNIDLSNCDYFFEENYRKWNPLNPAIKINKNNIAIGWKSDTNWIGPSYIRIVFDKKEIFHILKNVFGQDLNQEKLSEYGVYIDDDNIISINNTENRNVISILDNSEELKDLSQTPIDRLATVRDKFRAALLEHGIINISDLSNLTKKDFMKIPHIGKIAYKEVSAAMSQYGVKFLDDSA
jgi:hypothetical protein